MANHDQLKEFPDDLFDPEDKQDDDKKFLFGESKDSKTEKKKEINKENPWKILIVDDEEDIHSVTQIALRNFEYQGRGVEFYSAYSATEAKGVLEKHPDIALILLDVVMETNQAGLDLVKHIRETLKNRFTRIILRTGQPGQAPEREVIVSYEIDDYKTKTELTSFKLFTVALASLRAYEAIKGIEQVNKRLREEIQERIRMEKDLLSAKEKAEQDDMAKTEFLSQLSREIKAPLDTIMDSTSEIRKEINDKITEDIKDLFDKMTFTGKRIVRTVQLILDMSEVRTGNYKPKPKKLDLKKICEEVIKENSFGLHEQEIKFDFRVDAEDTMIKADEYSTTQIFQNLLDNAIKYTEKGKVTVHLGKNMEDKLYISVEDTGKGISESFIDKLFDPFTQENSVKEDGIGLGMTLVKAYVDLNEFKIDMKSIKNKGTKVTVIF